MHSKIFNSLKLASVGIGDNEVPAVFSPTQGVVLVRDLFDTAPESLRELIESGAVEEVISAASAAPSDYFRSPGEVDFVCPYRNPNLILGIGLNYMHHANDLSESIPSAPASFIKGSHTIIGPNEPIRLPRASRRTTAEAELGIVIGRKCFDVEESDVFRYLLGVCPVLDQTAEDILEENPRFLTRAKNYPTFFSFGPHITLFNNDSDDLDCLDPIEVSTVVGSSRKSNIVENMKFSIRSLVSFHSKVMPLFPGDIISPGTPGAIHVKRGDVAICEIPGIGKLVNPVQ